MEIGRVIRLKLRVLPGVRVKDGKPPLSVSQYKQPGREGVKVLSTLVIVSIHVHVHISLKITPGSL